MRSYLFFLSAILVLGQTPGTVTVLFSPSDPAVGPYPSGDRPAESILPCEAPVGAPASPDCLERQAIAELDGFALEPLLRVRFTGPVQPETLRAGIYLVYGPARHRDAFPTYPDGHRLAINQIAWDPRTNTAYAKPDEVLEQDRDYYLVITQDVRDTQGRPLAAQPCCREPFPPASGLPNILGRGVVAYTRFHTMNIVKNLLSVDLGRAGSLRTHVSGVLDLANFQSFELLLDTFTQPEAALTPSFFPPDLASLRSLGLRRLVFFNYTSVGGETVHGHAWLPETPPPPGGYPVVLIGHGLGDQRLAGPSFFASAFIRRAALLSINAVGHGFGPRSKLVLGRPDGRSLEIPVPGRGLDLDGTRSIDAIEGCVLFRPGQPAFIRDCLRRTALDYRKLVREIEAGIDFDGDGNRDLNSNQIQYLGQSLGAMYGSLFLALEPNVEAAVLNTGGGSAIESARYSPTLKNLLALYLSLVHPDVLTGFLQLPDPLLPRYAPVLTLTQPQAGRYLEILDRVLMLESDAAPAFFASFLKQATLYGNGIKRVLFQYAVGDQTVPNPSNTQLMRGAYEYELVSAYRHDLARQIAPTLPANPHSYLAAFVELRPETLLIGQAALLQASQFLASGKREVPDVNPLVSPFFGRDLFEVPLYLPEIPTFLP